MLDSLKFAFLWCYDHGIIPHHILPTSAVKKLTARSVFLNRTIKKDERGFYFIDPMPQANELQLYYSSKYWSEWQREEGVRKRDMDHFMFIHSYMPQKYFLKNITFLNFGAGHGGISHLFYHTGHKVINVEPSGKLLMDYHDDRWLTYKSISEVNESVDFIYGSHSLEHVQDIDDHQKYVMKILNKKGGVFWEVPNGAVASNNGCDGKIRPPHTYYFTTHYFASLNFKVIINQAYSTDEFPNIFATDGEVIRFLGTSTE
jgi:hypothetical protein